MTFRFSTILPSFQTADFLRLLAGVASVPVMPETYQYLNAYEEAVVERARPASQFIDIPFKRTLVLRYVNLYGLCSFSFIPA